MEVTQPHLDQIFFVSGRAGDAGRYPQKRSIELKRLRIAREVKEAQREHRKGLTQKGTIEDLIKDLESD